MNKFFLININVNTFDKCITHVNFLRMANFILEGEGFTVEIYERDHPPPHCHLVRNSGDVSVVKLPSLNKRHGRALSRQERRFLLENFDALCEAFDNRTPRREQQL